MITAIIISLEARKTARKSGPTLEENWCDLSPAFRHRLKNVAIRS